MKPGIIRPTLGFTAILLIILITYRKSASGNNSSLNTGKLLSVTAAAKLDGQTEQPLILVRGLLRKDPNNGNIALLDEDSVSRNPQPLRCNFINGDIAELQSLEEDTELVIEGRPGSRGAGLTQCSIISINNGTVYAEPFPEQ